MQQLVAITGLGVVSPIGLDVASTSAALREARSGVRTVRVPPLERDFAAGVIDASFEDAFTKMELPFLDRCQQLAVLAARQAVGGAGFDTFEGLGQRAGLYYGNVNGGVAAQAPAPQPGVAIGSINPVKKPFTMQVGGAKP